MALVKSGSRNFHALIKVLLGNALILLPAMASAQRPAGQSSGAAQSPAAAAPEAAGVDTFWTPERLRDAKPPKLPAPRPGGVAGLPKAAVLETVTISKPARGTSNPGSAPSVTEGGAQKQLLPETEAGVAPQAGGVMPEATSSFGAYFTTGRVFPDAALTAYPYSTAGKLFFTNPRTRQNFVCSASVLRPRIVVTAGHCVTNPSTTAANRFFFTNFLFVPAFNNGAAPFGSWTSSQQWVLNAWYMSSGSVPNAGDVAFLVMSDRNISGTTRKIGSMTGWLGYSTGSLVKNHVTMLGYPCNLDSCSRMQETTAGSFASGGSNTQIYGSAARGGASGGPWIQDFGINPVSNPVVTLGRNYLVGVTSYGPIATEPKYLGASILDNNFISVLTSACNATAGNC
jgi:V8-like Glu-specific endopeptidase